MGMRENWQLFVEMTKSKAEGHERYAQHWDRIHSRLSLVMIVFSAITTVLSALTVPKLAVVGVSGLTTLLSAIAGFLQPPARRQKQMESAKEFRSLMLQMIRCETDIEYANLWVGLNKEIIGEPYLPKKYKVKARAEYSMSPELHLLIEKKEEAVEEVLNEEPNINNGDVGYSVDDEQSSSSEIKINLQEEGNEGNTGKNEPEV